MNLRSSPLQTSLKPKSVLGPLQVLNQGGSPAGSQKHDPLAVALPLTSLIDAFSIIVIYLLIGTQTGGVDSNLPSQFYLPVAESGAQITQEAPTVRIEKGRYFINEAEVAVHQLGGRLAEIKKSMGQEQPEIIIQGDKKMTYAHLDPLIKAGSEAGIQKLKFAVTSEP